MPRRHARKATSVAIVAAIIAAVVLYAAGAGRGGGGATDSAAAISEWRPVAGFLPLDDAAAAAHVQPEPESRPANRRANAYLPSGSELRRFRRTRNLTGHTAAGRNPYLARVSGHFAGTSDEIIQWAAWKWGIPEDWLRAQFFVESRWLQSARGDRAFVGRRALRDYPARSRERGRSGAYTGFVWLSLGISQIKWLPDGSVNAGTEPLRWKSTAFAADYEAATLRFYYDDPRGLRSAWDDRSYAAGDPWLSISGWFRPYPWGNAAQRGYARDVQATLARRAWAVP